MVSARTSPKRGFRTKSGFVGLRSVIDWEACALLEMADFARGLLGLLAGGGLRTMDSLLRFLCCGGLEAFLGCSCPEDDSTTAGLAPEGFDCNGI